MKVAYVTMQFPATTETFAGSDVRMLRTAGIAVHVFALRPRHANHDEMLQARGLADVPVTSLTLPGFLCGLALMIRRPSWSLALLWWNVRHHVRLPGSFVRCLLLTPSAVRVFAAIAAKDFDVVHLFWGHYPAMVGHLVQRYQPQVVTSVFLGAYDLGSGRYGRWLPGAGPVARDADLVWTHSRSNLPRLRMIGIPADRTRCVHRGIDLREFPWAGHDERTPGSVVTVGSLIERKGMDAVLRVVAKVVPDVPDLHLHVLGDGPERSSLMDLASDLGVGERVTFHGHVAGKSIVEFLKSASAFMLLSREDRLPNVVKEAMAVGCPCIVTATQGMEELVAHGRTGYVVGIDAIDDTAFRLSYLLKHPERGETFAESARSHVVRNFSAETSMAEYIDAWRAAVAARRGGPSNEPPSTTPPPGETSSSRNAG